MGGPSRPGTEVIAQREERPSKKIKKEREESILRSQSQGRQVAHMVPGVLPPGAEGPVNHSHRKGLGGLSKLLN